MIIVDDASPDQCGPNSLKLIEKYEKYYGISLKHKIRVIESKKYQGLAESNNTAVSSSTGIYIISLNAGERIPSKILLEADVKINKDPELEIVHTSDRVKTLYKKSSLEKNYSILLDVT
jgi:Ni2+-binding GTPase involved in maturation of urease and hydrogenase